MRTIEDIKRERKLILEKQHGILDRADAAKRGLTEDEEREYATLEEDFKDIEAERDYLQKHPAVASWLSSSRQPPHKPETDYKPTKEDLAAMAALNTRGAQSMPTEFRYDPTKRDGADHSFNTYCRYGERALEAGEFRALQGDVDTLGGFLVMPERLQQDFIRAKKNYVVVRNLASVYTLENAASLGVPTVDAEMADPTWTAEIKTGTEDSSMMLGKRALTPHPIAKRIKVSDTLLRTSPTPEVLVRDSMAYRFAVTEETAFMTGSGQNQPLGLFTASTLGIDTSRDFTGSTSATVKADDLIDIVGNQKAQYRNGKSVGWIMPRSAETLIRKLKDGEGNYLWQNSIVAGVPNTLLGYPVYVSEYAPNVWSSGQYILIFGDFSYYWIVDNLQMRVQRLNELYAETNQVGFIGRQETDGMPVLAEAFTRLKLK